MDLIKRMLKHIAGMWDRMPKSSRWTLAALVGTMVILIVAGMMTATSSGMVKLVGNEDPGQARQIREKLDELNYKEYEFKNDGIYVPRADYDRLMIESSTVFGSDQLYSFLRESNLTISSWQLRQSLHNANQQKLSRMIGQIRSIKAATVQITPRSKQRGLGFHGPDASAAVTIELFTGKEFTEDNTLAVANLVSAAVEGLKPEHVKIMDTVGRLYQVPPKGSVWSVAGTRLSATKKWIAQLEEAVKKLYPQARTSGWVKLSSHTESSHETTMGAEPKTKKLEKSTHDSSSVTKGGQPGIKGEGDFTPGPTVGQDGNKSETEFRKEDEFDKTVKKTDTPAGQILEKSISVMIPVFKMKDEDDAAVQARVEQREANEAQTNKIRESIATATGTARVHVGFIVAVPPGEIPGPTGWEQFSALFNAWGGTVFLWVLAVVAVWFLYLFLKRVIPRDVVSEIDDMRKRLEHEALVAQPEIGSADQEIQRVKMTIRDVIARNPRNVATVLKKWITGK